MKTLVIILLFSAFTISADTLWSWTFEALPTDWTANGYWSFSPSGAHSHVSATVSGPGSYSQTATMVSPVLTVPDSVTSLTVSATDTWNWSGWATTGESNCCIWLRLLPTAGGYYTIEFDSHSWGFDLCTDDLRTTEVEVPLTTGDSFSVSFYSRASASYGGSATMDWYVEGLSISGNYETSLNRSTWADIKTISSTAATGFHQP
jgi:hypothetical protein